MGVNVYFRARLNTSRWSEGLKAYKGCVIEAQPDKVTMSKEYALKNKERQLW
jgi:hypothetical protein